VVSGGPCHRVHLRACLITSGFRLAFGLAVYWKQTERWWCWFPCRRWAASGCTGQM